MYEAHIIDRVGHTSGMVTNAVWSTGGNERYFVNVTGDYYAAAGGFDAYEQGYDLVQNRFYLGGGRWTSGTIRIAYSFGSPSNSLIAPSSVNAGETYSVSATTDDPLMVSPLTWSWYVDQQLVGTTSDGEFSVQAGTPSTTQEVHVVATDVFGRASSGTIFVGARSQCVDEYGNPVPNCQ